LFHKKITHWYLHNYRDLPWRNTKDPYKIWLSEIILQQTRVSQGMPYYERFVANYPTVQDLAQAPEQAILKLWEGLGYYSRARNLHFSAKYIATDLDGIFPKNYKDLLKLKGVGDYTAAAIASIAYKEAVPAIDGNVYRVLSRVFGIEEAIDSNEGKKIFKELSQELLDKKNPDTYNQAVMEFGATVCTPKLPKCESCIFNSSCYALANKKIKDLPFKKGKIKVRKRYFNYLVFLDENNNTIIVQRKGKGIWENLYQFPLFESEKASNEAAVLDYINNKTIVKSIQLYNEKALVHKLSHQHLYSHFWIIKTVVLAKKSITWKKLNDYPFPILIRNFIKNFHPKKNY
jgi:A/G-specific adenine glycosylase